MSFIPNLFNALMWKRSPDIGAGRPEVPGRVLDVSKGTADQLGMTKKGVAPVKVTVVKPPPPKSQKPSSQPAGPGAAPQGKQGDPRE